MTIQRDACFDCIAHDFNAVHKLKHHDDERALFNALKYVYDEEIHNENERNMHIP